MHTHALAALFKALSNPRRVEIVKLLLSSTDPLPMTTISTLLKLSAGPVSANLKVLTDVGLVMRYPHQNYVFFSVNRATLMEMVGFLKETKDE